MELCTKVGCKHAHTRTQAATLAKGALPTAEELRSLRDLCAKDDDGAAALMDAYMSTPGVPVSVAAMRACVRFRASTPEPRDSDAPPTDQRPTGSRPSSRDAAPAAAPPKPWDSSRAKSKQY